jgi:HAD superfamily hydrolase (TIGR01549 family)
MTDFRVGVLFDVDGTLCDTNYLHAVAWSRALREVGEYAEMSDLHHCIGMGGDRLLQTVIGHDSDEASEAYDRHFKEFSNDVYAFADAGNLLEAVSKLGAAVVLASSAKPDMLKLLRKALDADDVIDEATSSGEADESKPAPDIFQVAMNKVDLPAERCIAVGDTVWDVEAAGRAGMNCIGMLSGGISKSELEEAGAVAVYSNPSDLLAHLESSPIAELCKQS